MNSIAIKGYKSFRALALNLGQINVLIGSNGSGKSNFLSFFELLNAAYEQRLEDFVGKSSGVEKFFYEGLKVTESISAVMTFSANTYSIEMVESNGQLAFSHERLGYRNSKLDIAHYGKELAIREYSGMKRGDYIRRYLSGLKKYHFHDTGRTSPFTHTSNIHNDCNYLYSHGENLAAFLYGILKKKPKTYKSIIRIIRSVAPYFNDFYFNPNENGDIRLQWKDRFGDITYGPTDLSDGTIRFIALATLFLQPNSPSVIIIDEPELGLHPFAIEKLSALMQYAAQKGVQVIVATQSASLISFFKPDDVLTVNQVNGESIIRRLNSADLSEWLKDYSLGDLWQQNILRGGQPR